MNNKSPAPPLAGPATRRLGSFAWVWLVVVAAIIVTSAVVVFTARERDLSEKSGQDLALLRQTRIDLVKGYLHVTLAGSPASPFDRGQGLALLNQAQVSLEKATLLHETLDATGGIESAGGSAGATLADFAQSVLRFREKLAAWQGTPGADPAGEAELRIAFYALEQQANRVDVHIQQDLANLQDRQERSFGAFVAGAGILLALICWGVYLGTRGRQRAEDALRQTEARYRLFFEHSPDGIVILDPANARFLDFNETAHRQLGYTREEFARLSVFDVEAIETSEETRAHISNVTRRGREDFDTRQRTKQGGFRDIHVTAQVLEGPESSLYYCIWRDITDRKRAEAERDLTVRVLDLLNTPGSLHEIMRNVVTLLQEWTGCEAVGIRLREGEDYPYYETRGFPAPFVQMERSLCSRDLAGQILRDPMGNPMLDCMCGNILCRRFDPAKPFFTAHGSFWSSNTTQLLSTTTDADRQSHTRNRCNGEGYESVALIPLRAGGTVYGLLQFNDRRTGRFTPETIGLYERLGDSLAMALGKIRTEETLRDSEEHYRSLFDGMLNGYAYCRMIFVDGRPDDFAYLEVNPAFEVLTGLKDIVGKRASVAIPGIRESDPGLLERYGRVSSTGAPERFETFVASLNMWFSISVYSPRQDHFVAVFDVITDRKRTEQELRQLNAELEERVAARTSLLQASNRELEAFTYSVSHDLRSPLRTIDGYSQMLLEDFSSSLGAEGARLLNTIRANTQRMDQLITDLLALSRVGRGELRRQPVGMTSLARSVFEDMIPAAAERGEPTAPLLALGPLPDTFGDPNLLRQVWVNLIANAIKFTKPKAERRLEIGGRSDGAETIYYVHDNGVGFDPAYADKLFGVFQRLHKAEDFEGTGVGLAIVQRIVQRHGGRVWAEGQVNQGATFFFSLPNSPRRED